MTTIDVTIRFLACGAAEECLHVACMDCGTPMRQNKMRVADHPNTRIGRWDMGRCTTCVYQINKPRHYQRRPDHCTNCNAKTRPHGTLLADYPGTIAYGGRGKCLTCYSEARAAQNPYRGDCKGCGRAMRNPGLPAKQMPGSRLYKREGQCIGCHNRVLKGITETVLEEQERKARAAAKTRPRPTPRQVPEPVAKKPQPVATTAAVEERGMVDLEELKHIDRGAWRFTKDSRERKAKKIRAQALLALRGGQR